MTILRFEDRIMQKSLTTGLGSLTLSPVETGFKSFASVYAVDEDLPYCIEGVDVDGDLTGQWETGSGHMNGGGLLVRDTVFASSTGVLVNFVAPLLRVFVTVNGAALEAWLSARLPLEQLTLATHESTDLTGFVVVGSDEIVGADHGLAKFWSVASVSTGGLVGTVRLYNVTDNVVVTDHVYTGTSIDRQETVVVLPAGAKIYEIRIKVTGGAGPADQILLSVAGFQFGGAAVVVEPGNAFARQDFTATLNQTIFALSVSPQPSAVLMFVSGLLREYGADYTVAGSTLTWLNTPFNMAAGQKVSVVY